MVGNKVKKQLKRKEPRFLVLLEMWLFLLESTNVSLQYDKHGNQSRRIAELVKSAPASKVNPEIEMEGIVIRPVKELKKARKLK